MGDAERSIDSSNLRRLIEHNIPFANLEDAPIPGACCCHKSWRRHCMSVIGPYRRGAPSKRRDSAAFPSVHIGEQYLIDGAVGSNTPI